MIRALGGLLLLAGCAGRVEETPCTPMAAGSYEVTQTVVESDCATAHVGDVSSGRVDLACPTDGCAMVCDAPGAASTTWEATGPGQARVTFEGACRVVYEAELVPLAH